MSDTESVPIEQVDDFYEFLMGRPPAHLDLQIGRGHQPKLTWKQAFSVIWYLQEVLHVLPENYEACPACGNLFDADCSGHLGENGETEYCDNCEGE